MRPSYPADPKGLVAEAFRIEGIGMAECRTILLDWALSLPETHSPAEAIAELLQRHANEAPADHPMTKVLQDGLATPPRAKRRGGRSARLS